jgi:hypothetical protein
MKINTLFYYPRDLEAWFVERNNEPSKSFHCTKSTRKRIVQLTYNGRYSTHLVHDICGGAIAIERKVVVE